MTVEQADNLLAPAFLLVSVALRLIQSTKEGFSAKVEHVSS